MKILVTGAAGFIGFHIANRFIHLQHSVVGIDSLNTYYDVGLKYSRLNFAGITEKEIAYNKKVISNSNNNYSFYRIQLEDKAALQRLFEQEQFNCIIHLAAQAGVRYSLTNPEAYIQSNIVGFENLLECCKQFPPQHLVYASSSSVYGLNDAVPFSTNQHTSHPISLYAATKKSNELMAHVYSYLFKIPTTGLRFFTVYGPWGRPDMALFLFTKNILEGKPIQLFNYGNMQRDFTYIDDVVRCVEGIAFHIPQENTAWKQSENDISASSAPYKIYNVGNHTPVRLTDFIEAIEQELHKEAIKEYLPMQPGDVAATYADVSQLEAAIGYKPSTTIASGVKQFIQWYKQYYNVSE